MTDKGTEKDNDFKKEVDAIVEGAAGLFGTLREIFDRSRDEIARASRLGKTRIDLFQLEKDREHFLQRLGAACVPLIASGAIASPEATELYDKIVALDARKAEYQEEVARIAAEQAVAAATANEPVEPAAPEATEEEAPAPEPEPAPEKPSKKKTKKDL